MKLDNSEYMMDMNGTRIMYLLKTPVPSNALMKSIACKCILDVRNYYDYVDEATMQHIDELHPDFEYNAHALRTIIGGRKKTKANKHKPRINARVSVLEKLITFVQNNNDLSEGIVFINTMDECNLMAMNITYTNQKYKNAIVDFMKSLFKDSKNYKFKAFMHNDFHIPYDFKLIKHSCLINDATTGQPTYVANLYNTASYTPIPCYNHVFNNKEITIAHPIVKLRFLYIDMYVAESKTQVINSDAHKKIYYDKLLAAFDNSTRFDKPTIWVGYYVDDAFEKQRHNMMVKANTVPETFFI